MFSPDLGTGWVKPLEGQEVGWEELPILFFKKKKQVGLLLNNIIISLFGLFSGVSLLGSLCGGEFL